MTKTPATKQLNLRGIACFGQLGLDRISLGSFGISGVLLGPVRNRLFETGRTGRTGNSEAVQVEQLHEAPADLMQNDPCPT